MKFNLETLILQIMKADLSMLNVGNSRIISKMDELHPEEINKNLNLGESRERS